MNLTPTRKEMLRAVLAGRVVLVSGHTWLRPETGTEPSLRVGHVIGALHEAGWIYPDESVWVWRLTEKGRRVLTGQVKP
jgi:hypothetical protein